MENTIITVASGKGGTGKTTIASCLALSAKQTVQFLDCDVEEPNAHIFLKPNFTTTEEVSLEVPEINPDRCNFCGKCAKICVFNALAVLDDKVLTFPELCHSCGGCWTLCPEEAITTVPRQIGLIKSGHAKNIHFAQGELKVGTAIGPPVINSLKKKMQKNSLVIMDAPPGTSCPVVETMEGSDFVLLVTEPTTMGLNDLALAVDVVRELDIPCGVIINRCTDVYTKVQTFCQENNLPVLMTIALDRTIAQAYAVGIPPVEAKPEFKEHFRKVLNYIERVTAGARTCCH